LISIAVIEEGGGGLGGHSVGARSRDGRLPALVVTAERGERRVVGRFEFRQCARSGRSTEGSILAAYAKAQNAAPDTGRGTGNVAVFVFQLPESRGILLA
jgi:hypothetical protein